MPDARAAQRKVPAERSRSPAARTPDGVLALQEYGRRAENENNQKESSSNDGSDGADRDPDGNDRFRL